MLIGLLTVIQAPNKQNSRFKEAQMSGKLPCCPLTILLSHYWALSAPLDRYALLRLQSRYVWQVTFGNIDCLL
jgi:hypothetical protein